MKQTRSKFVMLLSFLALFIGHSEIQSSPCIEKFKNFQDLQKFLLSCMRSLGLDQSTSVQSSDQLAKNSYDDKCLANCLFGKMDLLNANKTVNTVALNEVIKSNAPSDSQSKLLEIVQKCSNSTVKKSKELDANEKTKNVCKYAALFQYCLIDSDGSENMC